ncbi:MAG: UDP-N-acetylmuramate dehydrogenase [Idiomarina sp.]|nr:UDP-N-acetylmuramate dehydrogenase [Idiomarina sp.]
MQSRHSFALPAYARTVIELNDEAQLPNIQWQEPFWILGEGTNTLFLEDFEGTVLVNQLRGVQITEADDAWLVSVAAGENWHGLVCSLSAQGIHGFENLALIPGSVGAAPVQNIGAYGVEVGQFITAVDIWDLQSQQALQWTHADCEFRYRESRFKRKHNRHLLITQVHFALPKQWVPELSYPDLRNLPADVSASELMARVIAVREAKLPDPKRLPNAGSFFKNPVVSAERAQELLSKYPMMPQFFMENGDVKLAAGWLIDQAGLKSAAVGDAAVHQQQALVLVNHGRASGEDLRALARSIQDQVATRYGVTLEPEVRLLSKQGVDANL